MGPPIATIHVVQAKPALTVRSGVTNLWTCPLAGILGGQDTQKSAQPRLTAMATLVIDKCDSIAIIGINF